MKFFSQDEIIQSIEEALKKNNDPDFTNQVIYFCKDDFAEIKKNNLTKQKILLKEAVEDHKLELIDQKKQIDLDFLTYERAFADFEKGSFFHNEEEEIRRHKCWLGFAALEELNYRKKIIPDEIVEKKNLKQKEITIIEKEISDLEQILEEFKKGEIPRDDKGKKISLANIKKRIEENYFRNLELKKDLKILIEAVKDSLKQNLNRKLHLKKIIKKLREEEDLYFPEASSMTSEYEFEYESVYGHADPLSKMGYIYQRLKTLEKNLLELKAKESLNKSVVKSKLDSNLKYLTNLRKDNKDEIQKIEEYLVIIENNDDEQIKKIYDEYFYSEYEEDKEVNEEDINFWESELSTRKKIINQRQIKEILHFTPFENVGSILKYGIMSNEEINKKDYHSLKVDNNRFDGRENFICTSVSFPNSRLLRFKQYSLGPFVLISISPEILLTNVCIFAKSNSATTWYKKPNGRSSFPMMNKNDSFLDMFSMDELRGMNKIPRHFTTDLQAEVLVYKKIPKQYINRIYCASDEIKLDLIKKLPELKERDSDFINVNPSFFEKRIDQDYWEQRKNMIEMEDESYKNLMPALIADNKELIDLAEKNKEMFLKQIEDL